MLQKLTFYYTWKIYYNKKIHEQNYLLVYIFVYFKAKTFWYENILLKVFYYLYWNIFNTLTSTPLGTINLYVFLIATIFFKAFLK